jgi:hypothetical protein
LLSTKAAAASAAAAGGAGCSTVCKYSLYVIDLTYKQQFDVYMVFDKKEP